MHLFSLAMQRVYLRSNFQMFISYYSRWRIQWNLCIHNNYKYLDKEWQCSEHSVFKLDCYKTFAQWTIFYKFWEFIFSAINVHLCMLAHMLCLDERRIFIFKVFMCVNTLEMVASLGPMQIVKQVILMIGNSNEEKLFFL